ncbi:MAG: LicD family protein [Clostridiales bacterium]|nr:LicD family protein [Clostridiales bacterium]
MSDKKRVYLNLILYEYNLEHFNFLKNLAAEYGSLTIGIPSDYVMARLFGEGRNGYSAERVRDFWLQFKFVEDIVVFDNHKFGYQDMYEKLHFDVCFYGSEYGIQFVKDKAFFESRGVSFLSLMPENFIFTNPIDSFSLSLKNIQKDKKLILFGTGKYFDLFIKRYSSQCAIAYAVDNNSNLWNTQKSSVQIFSLEKLKEENVQDCLVVLCAKNFSSMKNDLFSVGEFNYRTLIFCNPISLLEEMCLGLKAEDEYLKKAQRINLIMMAEVNRVCKKYNIPYYVICGSLIGVVRHHGFIPWDDDVDLAFTREGYEKLKSVAKNEWASGDFTFVDYEDYGVFYDFMPRLVYNKERLPIKAFDKVNDVSAVDVRGKLFVDFYIFEDAGKNPKRHYRAVKKMQAIYTMCMGHRPCLDFDEYKRLPKSKIMLLKVMTKIGSLIPLKTLFSWYEKTRRFAINENSDYYFCANFAILCIDRRIKKAFLGNGKEMQMENLKVRVPIDCDAFLENMTYHNYMNYPGLSVQKPSHYFNSDIEIW